MRKFAVLAIASFLLGGTFAGTQFASAAKKSSSKWSFVKSSKLGFDGSNTAKDDSDPQNSSNDVVSVDTDPGSLGSDAAVGALEASLPKGTEIDDLRNQLSLKYLFVDRTCAGGTRLALSVDEDGDKEADGQAWAYLGDGAFGGNCPEDVWTYEDMTDASANWDISQINGDTDASFDELAAAFGPGHQILSVSLADDSAGFAETARGCAYYDLIVGGQAVFANASDTSGNGADGKKDNDC